MMHVLVRVMRVVRHFFRVLHFRDNARRSRVNVISL